MKTAVIISGYFAPLHCGHLQYLESAYNYAQGGTVCVIVNNDTQLFNKKGYVPVDQDTRVAIIKQLRGVTTAHLSVSEDQTVCQDLEALVKDLRLEHDRIIFLNSGDRTSDTIPEATTCIKHNIDLIFDGQPKIDSSTDIIDDIRYPEKVMCKWGMWKVLSHPRQELKVKELIVNPHESLSIQQHSMRAEAWFVQSGSGKFVCESPNAFNINQLQTKPLNSDNNHAVIPRGYVHQLINDSDEVLHILEVQYTAKGDKCVEEDIKRLTLPKGYSGRDQ